MKSNTEHLSSPSCGSDSRRSTSNGGIEAGQKFGKDEGYGDGASSIDIGAAPLIAEIQASSEIEASVH